MSESSGVLLLRHCLAISSLLHSRAVEIFLLIKVVSDYGLTVFQCHSRTVGHRF